MITTIAKAKAIGGVVRLKVQGIAQSRRLHLPNDRLKPHPDCQEFLRVLHDALRKQAKGFHCRKLPPARTRNPSNAGKFESDCQPSSMCFSSLLKLQRQILSGLAAANLVDRPFYVVEDPALRHATQTWNPCVSGPNNMSLLCSRSAPRDVCYHSSCVVLKAGLADALERPEDRSSIALLGWDLVRKAVSGCNLCKSFATTTGASPA